MLHSVNAVLPWDKWLHKLTAHKGQFGFYEKQEREKCCWRNCPPRSAASQPASFWKLSDVKGAQSCDGSGSAARCVAVCRNTPSVHPCTARSSTFRENTSKAFLLELASVRRSRIHNHSAKGIILYATNPQLQVTLGFHRTERGVGFDFFNARAIKPTCSAVYPQTASLQLPMAIFASEATLPLWWPPHFPEVLQMKD